jgi:hypothetical protein
VCGQPGCIDVFFTSGSCAYCQTLPNISFLCSLPDWLCAWTSWFCCNINQIFHLIKCFHDTCSVPVDLKYWVMNLWKTAVKVFYDIDENFPRKLFQHSWLPVVSFKSLFYCSMHFLLCVKFTCSDVALLWFFKWFGRWLKRWPCYC